MRNLHLIGVRYNTPFFLEILADLGIQIEAERDKMILRRFLMGQLMTPILEPVRSFVSRTVCCTPVSFSISGSVGSLCIDNVDTLDDELLAAIKNNGFDPDAVKDTKVESYISDGELRFEISFMSEETDQEVQNRKNRADRFNAMLANLEVIDSRIHAYIASGNNISSNCR